MLTEIFIGGRLGINIIQYYTRNIVELDPTARKRGLSCSKYVYKHSSIPKAYHGY